MPGFYDSYGQPLVQTGCLFGVSSSSPAFGASSSPAFRVPSSSPAFGVSSSPAFGASSSPSGAFGQSYNIPFGSPSVFGQTHNADTNPFAPKPCVFQYSEPVLQTFGQQKPSFDGFGSATVASPFENSFQQSQPASGSTTFGSTPFRASSQPASTPAFGVSNSSVFASNNPAFRDLSTPAFGPASSTPAFGVSSTPAFGSPSSAFNFRSSPAFGQQSASAFGNTPFGTAPTACGAQNSPFGGSQATTPAFGSPGFGRTSCGCQLKGSSTFTYSPSFYGIPNNPFAPKTSVFNTTEVGRSTPSCMGSRVTPFTQTHETGGISGTQAGGKLESISAMPAYNEKSHEELRSEDYQAGDKGGPNLVGQSSAGRGFNTNNTQQLQQPNPFSFRPAFVQPNATNLSSSTTTTIRFDPKTSGFGTPAFRNSSSAPGFSIFGVPQSDPNPFASTPSPAQPSIFSTSNTSAFRTSSPFATTQAQGASSPFTSGLTFDNITQPSPLFQSATPSIAQTSSPFVQTPSAFAQAAPQSAPTVGQSNAFRGDMAIRNSLLQSVINNLTAPANLVPFQSPQPTQNPFGTLPTVDRVDSVGSASAVQYVAEQRTVVRIPVPTNDNPNLILEIEKLLNLRI